MSHPENYGVPTGGVPRARLHIPTERLARADADFLPGLSNADLGATPLGRQVGGDHYKKLKIQPMEYSMANKLDACQHTVVKYVTRFRDKGGLQDLEKAKHAIDLLIQHEYPNG